MSKKTFTDIDDLTKAISLVFFLSKPLADASHPMRGEPGQRRSQSFRRNGCEAPGDLWLMGVAISIAPWEQWDIFYRAIGGEDTFQRKRNV